MKDLVFESQQYKNSVYYASLDGTTADRTALDAALTRANNVFNTSSSAEDIALANALAGDSSIAPADANFIEEASKFAKAINGSFYVIGGIFSVALGISTIIKKPDDTLTVVEGSVSIAGGVVSVAAGFAALGLLSAAAFPPLPIIGGVLAVVSLILSGLGSGNKMDLYGGVDLYEQLEAYGFAKPGSADTIQTETDAQLDEQYPDTSFDF